MSAAAVCCTATPSLTRTLPALRRTAATGDPMTIALRRTPTMRLLHAVAERWSVWRRAQRERAELAALRQLDPRLLRDVGLGEFATRLPMPSWVDLERGLW